MIDLHTHTTESDGTYSPRELVEAAVETGLDGLAVTDHDTFAGFDIAQPFAAALGVSLYCGIEISTAWMEPRRKTVHLLGYFFNSPPAPEFRAWLDGIQAARRDRNLRLIDRLNTLGVDIQLEEVEALGRSMTGRPHFARVLVEKGFATSIQDGFDRYLDEAAPGYVERQEPLFAEAVERVRSGGGLPSLAHPVRLGNADPDEEARTITSMRDAGLAALEAWHSDHSPERTRRYLELAEKLDLKVTGGSDFHGENKPTIRLGSVAISRAAFDRLLE